MRFYNLMEEPVLLRPVEPRLAAVVGVVDHTLRAADGERAVERGEHELGRKAQGGGPAHDLAAARVEHDREVQEPCVVGPYVMSATQSRLGASAVKVRLTRSFAGAEPSATVVVGRARRLSPRRSLRRA